MVQDTTSVERSSRLLRICVFIAGLAGTLGVVSLALSSHSDSSHLFGILADMLLFHAPVFLGIGILAQVRRVPLLPVAVVLLLLGLTLFCGDLLTRILLERRLFPMSAPIGGMLTILGWIFVALSPLRIRPR